MRKYALIAAAMVALVGGAVAVWAAYDVTGSSGGQGFTSGSAANLSPDPDESDLSGILPGQSRSVDVLVTNPNAVGVSLLTVDLTFNDGGLCAFTTTPWTTPIALAGGASVGVVVGVSMGNADPSCEGNAGLLVTATATGTMP
ncbi:MAG: hypothetical protein WEB52_05890 [Dehalococcoidia bacterium]